MPPTRSERGLLIANAFRGEADSLIAALHIEDDSKRSFALRGAPYRRPWPRGRPKGLLFRTIGRGAGQLTVSPPVPSLCLCDNKAARACDGHHDEDRQP